MQVQYVPPGTRAYSGWQAAQYRTRMYDANYEGGNEVLGGTLLINQVIENFPYVAERVSQSIPIYRNSSCQVI